MSTKQNEMHFPSVSLFTFPFPFIFSFSHFQSWLSQILQCNFSFKSGFRALTVDQGDDFLAQYLTHAPKYACFQLYPFMEFKRGTRVYNITMLDLSIVNLNRFDPSYKLTRVLL